MSFFSQFISIEFNLEIGEEAKTAEFDNEIKLTPFNMKEELEEGDFDTDGYFHWKSRKGEENDAWLDNIDWANINSFKRFKGQENLLNAASSSGVITKNYDLTKTEEKSDNEGDDNDDEEEEDEDDYLIQQSEKMSQNEQIEMFKKIFEFLKPGENVLKAIKRLGNKGKIVDKKNMSASERWLKKKNTQTNNANTALSDQTGDPVALEKLTSYANKFIDMGYYDIYDETYEKIKLKLDQEAKQKSKSAEVDIFADDADEEQFSKPTTSGVSQVEGMSIKILLITKSFTKKSLFLYHSI